MPLVHDEVLQKLFKFRDDREWRQFHTPKNLSASIAVEAAELLECFLWVRESDLDATVVSERSAIEDEVADIVILLSYLCADLEIDIDAAVSGKLKKNELKYPTHLARGNATKYDRL